MKQPYLLSRLEELSSSISDGELSHASRRLLDMFTDFPLPESLRRKAIALRASYNAFAQLGQEAYVHQDWEEMQETANEILQAIEDELEKLYPSAAPEAETDPTAPLFIGRGALICEGKGISKTFRNGNRKFVLPPTDISLHLGEITGIVGENGNGKTTLLRMMAGDLEITEGELHYPTFEAAPEDWYAIKQHIAFIPQHLNKWNGYLKDNLHFTAAIHGIKGSHNEERVDFIIHRLGLSQYKEAYWSEISSGYKLRFELARALVWQPKLLIIDEPLANLDINTQQLFMQDLRYLASSMREPMSILLSSQHLHELESIADNIIFIKNGEALYNGSMKDFGKDRTENIFELQVPQSKSELVSILKGIDGLKIEDHGQYNTIRVPLEIESSQIIDQLVKSGVSIHYFRDISTSTLKLFRDHVEKN